MTSPTHKRTSIFDYEDYKTYLKDLIEARPQGGRGVKSALATAIRVQTAYVSQVFNGNAHLSLEQADIINRFFGHSKAESDFFLILVQYGRAGTVSLQKYFKKKIRAAVRKNLKLKNRLKVGITLSAESVGQYYGHWYIAAVHVMLSIPEFQTLEALSKYLRLSKKKIAEVLEFLVKEGLAVREMNRFKIGNARIHLPADSPHVNRLHTNWRIRALDSLDQPVPEDQHYSDVVSVSEEDAIKLKAMIVKFIEEWRAVVRPSKEEVVRCFCIDYFKV